MCGSSYTGVLHLARPLIPFLVAECISVRQLITQVGWNFGLYICMYIGSITLQECWLQCITHARLLSMHWWLAQSGTMQPHDRQSRATLPFSMQRSERWPYNYELYHSGQMIQGILIAFGFPRRGAQSTLCKLICRVVLILIAANKKVCNDCMLYDCMLTADDRLTEIALANHHASMQA